METERLELVVLTHEHSAGMFELWSSPEVCEFSGSAADLHGNDITLPARGPSDSDEIIRYFEHHRATGRKCRWALLRREDRRFLGIVGFNELGPRCELAYHLIPAHWGRGYMREAAQAVLAWALSTYPGTRVEAYIEPENLASVALAERLGFERRGGLRDGAVPFRLVSGAGVRGGESPDH